jgi:N-methylhydantoinase B
MSDETRTKNPTSLEDLLSANKDRFDQLFSRQLGDASLLSPTTIDQGARPASPEGSGPSDAVPQKLRLDTNTVVELNRRFDFVWSWDVLESKAQNDKAVVRVKLTVEDRSKADQGSASLEGDPVQAFGKALTEAILRCADQFTGHAPDPHEIVDQPSTVSSPSHSRQLAPGAALDVVTLDLIENALRNARHEMDALLFRSAMSPVIREQHDEFPMITDAEGRMIVGQFGSYITEMLKQQDFDLKPGDVILQSDPYKCGGAISHINDWMVLIPIFVGNDLVGFSSMFGHMMDVGGPVPGSMPTAATSIFGEGIRIPPVKIYDAGVLNSAALDILMNNTRTPEMNYSDLMAIVAGCRAGERRVMEICDRFGTETYLQACENLLERTNRAMRKLIVQNLPVEPQSFEDYVDDDGCGNGPFKMKLTVWREGDHAYFDWTGTSDQAPGPINFYLHDGMFKMFIGVYMIMVFDPQILFNDGFYDLIHVTLPKGSLVNPEFPAALGCRTHALSRQFDVMGGALSRHAPEMATAAGYGSSPHFLFSGVDRNKRPFQLMEILYGGIPGRPIGDGMDGHSWWPLFENIPTEYLENFFPLVIERYESVADTGGAGKHRGGNGIEKVYRVLEAGDVSIHDDRQESQPWGILGGAPGACSEKWIVRGNNEPEPLPAKIDNVRVEEGDRIIFRTAGGGGWGDPLERDATRVRNDVARKLMSADKAREAYGVVLNGRRHELDLRATTDLREATKHSRKSLELFDFGERRTSVS